MGRRPEVIVQRKEATGQKGDCGGSFFGFGLLFGKKKKKSSQYMCNESGGQSRRQKGCGKKNTALNEAALCLQDLA